MSHIDRHALRLSLIWPHSKSMHRNGLGDLVFPTVQYLNPRCISPLACQTPMYWQEPGAPKARRATRRWPFVNSSSRWVSETPAACDDVLLVNQCRYELEPVKPHHSLLVVAVGPKGVEHIVGASGDVGIIAEEGSTEAVACVDELAVDGVRAPAQVADDVVESRVVYVGPEKVTCDATNRRRRPGKARLPRRNRGASVSGEINVTICCHRCGWEDVLDRTRWRWRVKRRAIAAISRLAT